MKGPLVNKTLAAAIVGGVLTFSLLTIVLVLVYGDPHNSNHASALSWSYSMVALTLAILLGDSAITRFLPTTP